MSKFFKIPVKPLLKQLSQALNRPIEFNVSQAAMIDGLENNRFWVHISARRTGKSYAASILALAKLLEPNTSVMVVAPNFTLSSIIWDYISEFIRVLDLECERFNSKDKVIKLINGSVFRLLSAVNRDSLIGRGAHFLIVDEAAVIEDDEYFTRDLRPALSTFENSRALFISTPRGRGNYLFDYYSRGTIEGKENFPDWGSCIYDWTANPLLSASDIEEAKSTLPKQVFEQEYYCAWTIFEGQIYELDEEIHLCDTEELENFDPFDYRWDIIGGLDMGYRDDTAFVVVATNGDKFFILDSYTRNASTTAVHAEALQELIDKWGIENIYGDPAAAQMRADLAYDYDICVESANKSVLDGIATVQVLIEQGKLIIDQDNARDVFTSLSAYRWNNKTEKQKPIHDEHSHYADAVRYAIYTYLQTSPGIFTA